MVGTKRDIMCCVTHTVATLLDLFDITLQADSCFQSPASMVILELPALVLAAY